MRKDSEKTDNILSARIFKVNSVEQRGNVQCPGISRNFILLVGVCKGHHHYSGYTSGRTTCSNDAMSKMTSFFFAG